MQKIIHTNAQKSSYKFGKIHTNIFSKNFYYMLLTCLKMSEIPEDFALEYRKSHQICKIFVEVKLKVKNDILCKVSVGSIFSVFSYF